jgi:hypothetical protein
LKSIPGKKAEGGKQKAEGCNQTYEGRKRSGLSIILPIILPSSSYLTTN